MGPLRHGPPSAAPAGGHGDATARLLGCASIIAASVVVLALAQGWAVDLAAGALLVTTLAVLARALIRLASEPEHPDRPPQP